MSKDTTAPAPADPLSLLTRAQVAQRLGGISVKTVDRLREAGKIRGLLIGTKRFYPLGEVLAYLDDQLDEPAHRGAA